MSARLLWLAAILTVAACGSVQTIDASFAGLKGQPIASAVTRLGTPESRQPSASGTTYVWTDRVRDDTPVPTQKTTYENGRAATVEVMARPEPPVWRTCTLNVLADGAGTIVSAASVGTSAACAPMARKAAT